MFRSDLMKLAFVLLATVAATVYLFPTYEYYSTYYSMPKDQLAKLTPDEQNHVSDLRKKSLHLGLDLQGGMLLRLHVDTKAAGLGPAEARGATDRALDVLRKRIDKFGVAEPDIQKEVVDGEQRIAIQLPGLTDRERAQDLIRQTALLEFKLVREPAETQAALARLDAWFAQHPAVTVDPKDTLLVRHPIQGRMIGELGFFPSREYPAVRQMLESTALDSILPPDTQVLWGTEEASAQENVTGYQLYVVRRTPEMGGGSIQTATAHTGLDQQRPSAWGVSMKMTPRGSEEFGRVTSQYVNRRLAIVLDSTVQSAPNIRNKILNGEASITGGNFEGAQGDEHSRDLATVLQAGALPAPVRQDEERTVGASLGADSIHQGVMAGLVGSVMVIVFMLIYYRLSGLIAIIAMILNTFYVVACLVGFHATLTLPGIAGLVLTVGMAVDTNVLIFERIREELRNKRGIRQAVEMGYDRAFRTVFDAHSTAIISGLFLFQFGTGPIKGFAVTLITGLVANLFTAVLFTRMIYDFWLSRGKIDRLSI